ALTGDHLTERPREALEGRLDHVVRIVAAQPDMDIRAERLGERAEEMRHELGRQAADPLARERALEDEIGPPAEVDRDLRVRLVHRQQEAVTADAVLVAERALQRIDERERDLLDRVMLVDLEIAVAFNLEREAAVLADLLEHMVVEADA